MTRFDRASSESIRWAITGAAYDLSLAGVRADEALAFRRSVCESIGVSFDRLTVGAQVHGAGVAVVRGDLIGRGRMDADDAIPDVDSLVTNEVGVPLMVLSADCAPIAVFDPMHRAIAVIHAGWRGIVAGVVDSTIQSMETEFGSRAADCLAFVGPCARDCCYQVGINVATAVESACNVPLFGKKDGNGHYYLDIAMLTRRQLQLAGLRNESIDVSDCCTVCNVQYHSHRRDGVSAGRNGLALAIAVSKDV